MNTEFPTDPQAVPPPHQLRRSGDRILGGVCGGVAEYLGVSANVVRLVTLVLLCLGGQGFLLYFVGWLLLPDADGPSAWEAWRARRQG